MLELERRVSKGARAGRWSWRGGQGIVRSVDLFSVRWGAILLLPTWPPLVLSATWASTSAVPSAQSRCFSLEVSLLGPGEVLSVGAPP